MSEDRREETCEGLFGVNPEGPVTPGVEVQLAAGPHIQRIFVHKRFAGFFPIDKCGKLEILFERAHVHVGSADDGKITVNNDGFAMEKVGAVEIDLDTS